jgi:hypothetical protein
MLPEVLFPNDEETYAAVPLPESVFQAFDGVNDLLGTHTPHSDIAAMYARLGYLLQKEVSRSDTLPGVYGPLSVKDDGEVDVALPPDRLNSRRNPPVSVVMVPIAGEIAADMGDLKTLYRSPDQSRIMSRLIKIGMMFHSHVLSGHVPPGIYGRISVSEEHGIIPLD